MPARLTSRGGGTRRVRGVIEYRGLYPRVAMKELRPAVKEANQEVIRAWHRDYLPRHFQETATRRYGYQARTRAYRKAKQNKFGHGKPLVWTGDTERMATRQVRVSGTSKRARGRFPGSQALNFGGRRGMPPMREEMLRTVREERRDLGEIHGRTVEGELARFQGRDRKVV